MVNNSESPEGKEQTKTSARSRTSARSQSENAPVESQETETETKPVTRRRATTSTARKSAATPTEQDQAQATMAASGSVAAPTPAPAPTTGDNKGPEAVEQKSKRSKSVAEQPPMAKAASSPTRSAQSAEVKEPAPLAGGTDSQAPTQQASRIDVNPPAQRVNRTDMPPAQRVSRPDAPPSTQRVNRTDMPPAQRVSRPDAPPSTQRVNRPDALPAQRVSRTDMPPAQRTNRTDMPPAQRTNRTDMPPAQRTNRTDMPPAQRTNRTDMPPASQRTGPSGFQAQRPNTGAGNNAGRMGGTSSRPGGMAPSGGGARPGGGSQTPTQRLGQQRPGMHSAATAQQGTIATPNRQVSRPGYGNGQGGPARQGGGTRPGGPTRTDGHGQGGSGRPGARPNHGTSAARTQERRSAAVKEKPTGPIAIPPQIVVKDLAELMQATPNEVIRGLIKHGVFAGINQVVDYEKAALVATEMGFEPAESALTTAPAVRSQKGLSANEAMMASRNEDNSVVIPPVVTIMGHVDHGKTSLLDTIRKTKVAAGEAGGITQHIGAYQVEVNGKKITFLDTPGHEAFTAMRARGAQVTHIAIIVVAADDGVMPQTREAIDHARAAKVPIIIALNKIDKANANPDHVKQQLAETGVLIEEYGGDVVCVPVSARRGTGIDELLEMILLVAELQEIKANPDRPASGVIIEAKLEKSTGPTATVLIQQGTLKMGDNIVVGGLSGKVRAMFNDRGKRIQKAPPSMPVSILGLPEVPNAGDHLEVVLDEKAAKQKAQLAAEQLRDESMPLGQVSLDTLYMQMQEGNVKELNLVLKCDVQGSAEALKHSLSKIGDDNMKVRLIHEGIGNISETDVHLAAASGAIIIGFSVKADGAAQRQAQKEGVDIRYYNVIYKLIDDIQAALTGMLEPTYKEVIEGHAEVVQTFKAGKNMVIAGCRITDGKITRSAQARATRGGEKVFDGKIASLRRGKDDVREVASGYECGIVLEDYNGLEVGDIIEAYAQERVKAGV